MTWSHWFVVLTALLLISIAPGAGAVNSMAMGLDHGVRRAWWTIAGQQLSLILQLVVVAAGLGAVIAASPLAFEIVRWGGVAYLVYLGVSRWRETPTTLEGVAVPEDAGRTRTQLFWRGMWVNSLNPKAIVFIVAIMPQLLMPDRPQLPQWVILAVTMLAVDTVVITSFATAASRLRGFFSDPVGMRRLNRFFGALFVLAAVALALAEH